jgi:hypothetical protein
MELRKRGPPNTPPKNGDLAASKRTLVSHELLRGKRKEEKI